MRWFRRRQPADTAPIDPLDLDQALKEGRRDASSARDAIARLDRERRDLERQQKVVDRQFNRLTSGKVKRVAWSNSGNPQIEANMLADAMREANAVNEMDRSNQLASIDTRLQALANARRELEQVLRRIG